MSYSLPDFEAERFKPAIAIKESMLYCLPCFQVNVKNLVQVTCDALTLFLYYDKGGTTSLAVSRFTSEEVNELKNVLGNYIKNAQILRIFKNLQSVNPIASPTDIWNQAEETYNLLEKKGLAAEY